MKFVKKAVSIYLEQLVRINKAVEKDNKNKREKVTFSSKLRELIDKGFSN